MRPYLPAFGSVLGLSLAIATQICSGFVAIAATTFNQQEVNPENFILLAVPRGQTAHSLMIVEQISNKRPCWQENNDPDQTVEPLLSQFDFTGICQRYTDSNAFSIRAAGEELGLRYTLRLAYRDNTAVLVGTPNRRDYPEVELGRTQSITPNFMKITLDPNWRLTRRTYNDKPLGHVYLTSDLEVAAIAAAQSPSSTPAPLPIPVPAPTPIAVAPTPIPVSPPPQSLPLPEPAPLPTPAPVTVVPISVPAPPSPVAPPSSPPTPAPITVVPVLPAPAPAASVTPPPPPLVSPIQNNPTPRTVAITALPPVDANPPLPPGPTEPVPPVVAQDLANRDVYYVVVPGTPSGLALITDRIQQLGVSRQDLQHRQNPRGPHVAMGPFVERDLAEKWSRYFRESGLDSRVYYGR